MQHLLLKLSENISLVTSWYRLQVDLSWTLVQADLLAV